MHDVKDLVRAIDGRLGRIELSIGQVNGRLDKMEGRLDGMDGRLDGMTSRLGGVEFHIAALPTTWTILGIVFTTWAVGSGILIFAMNFLHR